MKLLSFGLKVHSRTLRFCMCKTQKRIISSVEAIAIKSSDKFVYQYDMNELLRNVSATTKNVACNELQLQESLNLETQYSSVISSVILAAKNGLLDNLIDKNTCDPFFDVINRNIEQMTAEDVVSTLIVLSLLNVPLHHPINRKLTIRVTHMLKGNKYIEMTTSKIDE